MVKTKSVSRSELVRRYIAQHPNAPTREVMEATGSTAPIVYSVRTMLRLRQTGTPPAAANGEEQQQPQAGSTSLLTDNLTLRAELATLRHVNADLQRKVNLLKEMI